MFGILWHKFINHLSQTALILKRTRRGVARNSTMSGIIWLESGSVSRAFRMPFRMVVEYQKSLKVDGNLTSTCHNGLDSTTKIECKILLASSRQKIFWGCGGKRTMRGITYKVVVLVVLCSSNRWWWWSKLLHLISIHVWGTSRVKDEKPFCKLLICELVQPALCVVPSSNTQQVFVGEVDVWTTVPTCRIDTIKMMRLCYATSYD